MEFQCNNTAMLSIQNPPGGSTVNSIVAAMVVRDPGYFLLLHDGNIVRGIVTVILIFYTSCFCKQGTHLMNEFYWGSLCWV